MLLLASGYCIILCIVSMHKFHKKKASNGKPLLVSVLYVIVNQ